MNRKENIEKLAQNKNWDVIVIGGGASGLGAALDAVTRGFNTLLVESHDFAKGTSSRSTKLVHGGVRYLAQGYIDLVLEALHERGLLAKNAAHLVKNQTFIIPNYRWWEGYYYKIGLSIYDLMARKLRLGKTQKISKTETIQRLSTINTQQLCGGIVYRDGQFDDSRLAINLAQSIADNGGTVINYMAVVDLPKSANGRIKGVILEDVLTGERQEVSGKVVINATGVFTNNILQMDKPTKRQFIVPSQGIHLVLDRSFLPGDDALMIPKTDDGRVLFAVPWHDKVVVGTTDVLVEQADFEPKPLPREVEFILATAGRYLSKKPTKEDVLSVFAGLRPLAAPEKEGKSTKEVSRSHKVIVSDTGLVTITGGKWTTYRKMAADVIDKAISVGNLDKKMCVTEHLAIHGNLPVEEVDHQNHQYIYGSDMKAIQQLSQENPDYTQQIHPNYPYLIAEVIWAVREEMAQTVEDVLARRVRLLFLDARAAIDSAEKVATVIAKELGHDHGWITEQITIFTNLAKGYLLAN
ncbi:MAG: FAD-dependent oxidoreductase [Cardiobacteriales bacterium]|nr:MAG: FAD-dependent oxidoreductase [Cardiobacteriales bacterium]